MTASRLKLLNIIATIVSIVVPITVAVLLTPGLFPNHIDLGFNPYILPRIYSTLNGVTALILLAALWAVKNGNIQLHKQLMTTAVIFSAIFLVMYIVYHLAIPHTPFGGQGLIRKVYFFVLMSHIGLSIVTLPIVLFAYLRGWAGEVEKHKRLVKFAFPLWLYICVTGVIVYFMISPYYPG
jgi:putative membrane protein